MKSRLAFDELNQLESTVYSYEYTDKVTVELLKRVSRLFNSGKSRLRNMKTREAIRYSKELYKNLYDDAKKVWGNIAKNHCDECDDEWLYLLLKGYDPLFKLVVDNEVERKRQRFIEAVLSGENPDKDIDAAKTQWGKFVAGVGVKVTDDAEKEKLIKQGVKQVVWITMEDERTCSDCAPLHGQIFNIKELPEKPHINCRCRIVPYKG